VTSLTALLRRARLLTLGVLFSVCFGVGSQAQDYPDRPVRLIAPFPAGGLADVLARAVGDEISRTLGQPVIVENRAGAGGNIGADAVAKSAPDGYTLLMTSAGILTANQFLYSKMPFDPEKDFVPVSNVADMPMMVVVNPKVEAKTLQELVALVVDFADGIELGFIALLLELGRLPTEILEPANTWGSRDEYFRKYDALAARFIENFKLFSDGCPKEVIAAGPKRRKP